MVVARAGAGGRTGPRPRERVRGRGDGGQAVVFVALVVGAVAVAAILLIGQLGGTVVDRQRARTAADAAALAGVTAGRSGAVDVAGRNGGTLEWFRTEGRDVIVQVRVGRARASSRAAPGPPPSGGERR